MLNLTTGVRVLGHQNNTFFINLLVEKQQSLRIFSKKHLTISQN
jgi:hypothetical protein